MSNGKVNPELRDGKYIHPVNVPDYRGGLKQLARDIGNLRYDAMRELFHELSIELIRQSEADMRRNRPMLQKLRFEMAHHAMNISIAADSAMRISENRIDMSQNLDI